MCLGCVFGFVGVCLRGVYVCCMLGFACLFVDWLVCLPVCAFVCLSVGVVCFVHAFALDVHVWFCECLVGFAFV